jgi:hypothetical protein
MTKLLERAFAQAQNLPAEMQDDIARIVLTYAGGEEAVIQLTPEEEADLAEADAEVARGEFATEAQMQAIWDKRRP